MKILIYFPTNKNSNSIETVARHFVQQGHTVHFLSTQDPHGAIHQTVKAMGVQTHEYVIPKGFTPFFYFKHIWHLARFVRKNKIDLVYSHIQQPNLVAVFAQFFCRARFIICRHHSDVGFLYNNRREILTDKIINRLGRQFIAPCQKVYDQMVKEGVSPKKIHLIRYAYDFCLYAKPDPQKVQEIREQYKAHLLLVKAARYVHDKRHIILFNSLQKLIHEEHLDIRLLCISDGPDRPKLEKAITDARLEKHVFLLGFKTNVTDYLASADLVVHLSISEASNSIIKESGLVERPVVICGDVGDFDDYVKDGLSGIVLDKNHPEVRLDEVLRQAYKNKEALLPLGHELKEQVFNNFSFEHITPLYDALHQKWVKK